VKRIAIIGSGISGLAAAVALEKAKLAGAPLEYRLFEATARCGGVLLTESVEGCIVEAGPDSFLTEKSWAIGFCRELGLGDRLIGSNDAQRKTYIYLKDRLVPMPDGLSFMVPTKLWPIAFSRLFSMEAKLRMAREWFSARRGPGADESVADFIGRHYGSEMIDRLADPLLSGVYGGSASQLSVQSVLPRFVAMENQFGSLGKGMIATRKKMPPGSPIFTSFKNGMQQMVDAILAKIPLSAVRTNTQVDSLTSESGRWTLSFHPQSENFDAVILAIPAYTAGSLLRASAPELTQELHQIPYNSSVTVVMGFDRNSLAALPHGFGFLIPRSENKRMLAATFVHQKFPNRAPQSLGLIRCFLGGSVDEQIVQFDEQAIQKIVQDELRQILGLTAAPVFTRIFKWKKSMAQYTVGHASRIARIQLLASQFPNLALSGNAYLGIGVPDCIRSGTDAAAKMLAALGV
jgi:oxygen-dependent protoporphyrinogen oxidase